MMATPVFGVGIDVGAVLFQHKDLGPKAKNAVELVGRQRPKRGKMPRKRYCHCRVEGRTFRGIIPSP
jgi:hypothetical protein